MRNEGAVGQEGRVGAAGECRRVKSQHRRIRIDVPLIVRRQLGCQPLLVLGTIGLHPPGARLGGAQLGSGLEHLLPEHDLRLQIAEHEPQLLGGLPPVGGAQDRACLGAADKQLQDMKRRLAKPQHPVAGADPGRCEPGRHLAGPTIDLRVGEPGFAVDNRDELWSVAAMLPAQGRPG